MDDAALELRLYPPSDAAQAQASDEPDWSYIHAEMKRRGVTMVLLWQEYRSGRTQGQAYSTFCERFRAWKACVSPTMRQTHVAGEKLFVDWAGDTIGVFDVRPNAPEAL